MDALSEVISFLKPKTVLTGITEGHAPWGLLFSGYTYVKFGFISEGQCWLTLRKNKPVLLEEGDAWILIRPVDFRIGSEIDGPTVHQDDFFKEKKLRYIAGQPAPKSAKTVIFGGGLYFDETNAGLILDNLPQMIVLKKARVSPSLKSIMTLL